MDLLLLAGPRNQRPHARGDQRAMVTKTATRRVRSPKIVNVQDFRPLARRRLPKVVFDYLDGGAEDEITLRENRRAFEEVTFRPRHAVAFSQYDLRTRVLGCDLA